MTVCISALSNDRKKAIAVSDTMITASIPIQYEFETKEVNKIHKICDYFYISIAGDALSGSMIVSNLRNKIKEHDCEKENKFPTLLNLLKDTYVDFRLNRICELCLLPRGLKTLQDYYNMQTRLTPAVHQQIENQLLSFNLGVEMIITGYDGNECHIYTISHPNVLVCHDSLGYATIGSGAPHSHYYLIGSEYKKSEDISKVKVIILEAKKRAQVAPGVGDDTITEIIDIPIKKGNDHVSK